MLTRAIDAALDSLFRARERVPYLRDLYPQNSPERTALEDVLAALGRADAVLKRPKAPAPERRPAS